MDPELTDAMESEIREWVAYKDQNKRFHNVVWDDERHYTDLVYVPSNGTWVKSSEGYADKPS
jgi:hypothetical protein